MAYERDDRWRGRRDQPYGYDEDRERSAFDRYRSEDRYRRGERFGGRDSDQRGFFERAGDEIASWFGEEDERDYRSGREHMGGRELERGSGLYAGYAGSRGGDRDERRFGHKRDRDRDEERSYRPMRWTSSERDYREGMGGYPSGQNDYRPVTGDYGRGSERGREHFGDERRDFGRSDEYGRDPYRRTAFAGSAAAGRGQGDESYDQWRRRHMAELDRDYDDYRREHQSRFESDFGDWRERRQGKRQLLGQVREHMEVVGSDDEHVGTVDKIAGDRIILTKSDPESGGAHHSVNCTSIDRVEDGRVILDVDAERARERWRDEDHDRALFEREDQGEAGPGILNRSFSGTYR